MLRLAVLFATAIIGKEIYCLQELDLEDILQLAEVHDTNQDRERKYNEYNSKPYAALESQDIAELVQQAADERAYNDGKSDKREYIEAAKLLNELNNGQNTRLNSDDIVTFGHYYGSNKDSAINTLGDDEDNEHNAYDESYKHNLLNEQALNELLSRNIVNKKYQSKPKSRFVPVESYEYDKDRNDDGDKGDEYSKIYIILNPQAIEKSYNKDNLKSLLSKILSIASSSQETGKKKRSKDRRYKGFPVKSELFARRVRRDSREAYAKDSMEDDYKPKRSRGERGGGGVGGAGGRTAIPYIRNRGDIYERDH